MDVHTAGRLAPIAALVEAARARAPDLGERLEACFGETLTGLPGLEQGRSAVWHDTGLFAISSAEPPTLSIDHGEPSPMTAVPGTPYWVALATLEPGRLHTFRYAVGEWSRPGDVAGFTPSSYEQPGVKRGTVSERRTVASAIYPGATTDYWLYVNHGIDETRGAPVMVWHDGERKLEPHDLLGHRMQIVTDNLAQLGLVPPTAHLLVSPSSGGEELPTGFDADRGDRPMRVLQYATVSDRYGRHLLEEVLPDAERVVKLRSDAYSRGTAGLSHGGHCAFKLAWLQPAEFSRAHCSVSTFTPTTWDPEAGRDGGFIYAQHARREPRRNIRVWLSSGTNDMELAGGSWPLGNIELANALKLNGYDFRFRFGDGHHGPAQTALDLPESLAWLWRDYDPDRSEQIFEQEPAEREKPPFRVSIANRDA